MDDEATTDMAKLMVEINALLEAMGLKIEEDNSSQHRWDCFQLNIHVAEDEDA